MRAHASLFKSSPELVELRISMIWESHLLSARRLVSVKPPPEGVEDDSTTDPFLVGHQQRAIHLSYRHKQKI